MSERKIEVPVLARVEGEGALHVKIRDGQVEDLRLRIFEPPRFFETFLQQRDWREIPDITSRICGICPVAYQLSSSQAIEAAFGAVLTPEIRALRRLYYCGEWIESHALHIHLLAAPDFFGFPDAMSLAKSHPAEVRRGLHLQGLGNDLVKMFGGRAVNPVGARPGGFYRAPSYSEVRAMLERFRAAQDDAAELIAWTAKFNFPDIQRDAPRVSLRHHSEYPMAQGNILASTGLEIDVADFEHHYREFQVPHSTALHAHLDGKPYWVGPLPRLNNNLDRLPDATAHLLEKTGIRFPSNNPFHSAVARAVEIHIAIEEAIRILAAYLKQPLPKPYVNIVPKEGEGAGCTEAPRGLLWHRYRFNAEGKVVKAVITPPTSQNQAHMENDLRQSVLESLDLDDGALQAHLEAGVRNYDPCISCSTHFLKTTIDRGD